MKNILLTSLAAGTLASAALGLAGTASAAPSGPSSVDAMVSQLRAQGYAVILNRTGTAPVDQCTCHRSSSRTDVFAHRLRCAWSQGRPRHDRDGQDRLRRRHVLTELNTRSKVSSISGRGFGVVG